MKSLGLSSFLFIFLKVSSFGQFQKYYEPPDLKNLDKRIENTISFFTSKSARTAIEDTSGKKIPIKAELLVIHGDTIAPDEITTRGQSTLHYFRKSYGFDLQSKAFFTRGDQGDSLKKFYVLSLAMDKFYHNNRLAYEMMKATGIFRLFYAFCEVRINGQSDGIHMIVERPDEWAMKKKDSPFLIRRGYNGEIDNFRTNGRISKEETANYLKSFKGIYHDLNRLKGEALYKSLSARLDLEKYMKWLAFNFLIRNGDYTDEVYFYHDPKINKFSVIPWDYDDIFMIAPHEGKDASKKILGGKLLFSAEDLLDRKIATDTCLYNIYLRELKGLLKDLSADVLKRIFEHTYAELYPYYCNNEIMSMAHYDAYPNASLENLRNDLLNVYDYLNKYRDFYYNYLKDKKVLTKV